MGGRQGGIEGGTNGQHVPLRPVAVLVWYGGKEDSPSQTPSCYKMP